jgi:hypothetical protein
LIIFSLKTVFSSREVKQAPVEHFHVARLRCRSLPIKVSINTFPSSL